MIGAVEGGGTKFLCAVGEHHDRIARRVRIDTTSPDETLGRVVAFLRDQPLHQPLEAVGLAMFGPLELRPGVDHGSTLGTPKPGWSGVPVGARLRQALGIPVAVDTDVNAAALAEQRWGAAQGMDPVVYVTVGTGVGGGVVANGRPVHGLLHPEIGHLPAAALEGDGLPGACPFHRRCLEGLVSGPGIASWTGADPSALPDDHPAWDRAARILGATLASVVLTVSPRRIVIGGGIGARLPLASVRRQLSHGLGGYLPRAEVTGAGLERFVCAPGLAEPGLAGAFLLATDPRGFDR